MKRQRLLRQDWQAAASSLSRKMESKVAQIYDSLLPRRSSPYEYLAVGALLAVALVVRLALAARGWPHTGSDEATTGLMADDILWHQAHPIFFGGSHYLGALQAYVASLFFAVFGSNNFVLHVVTTLQITLFLLVFYAFVRTVFSPLVAIGSIFFLALGPSESLLYELRAGGHAQDLFLFGSLTMWLVVLRLRRPWSARQKIALALAIGATIGLGFWGTFLVLPFVVPAVVALGVEAIRRGGEMPLRSWLRQIRTQIGALALGLGIALTPFIAGTIMSHGIAFQEITEAAGSSGTAAHAGIPQQLLGTLIVALPGVLGRDTVCANCGTWPALGSTATAGQAFYDIMVALPFDLIAIGFWALAAYPLGRDVWQVIRHWRRHGTLAGAAPAGTFGARWWGRFMLVVGGALTFGAFIATKSAYVTPHTSNRYIMGLYLCTPLAVEPLMHGARNLWNWLVRRVHISTRAKVLAVPAVVVLAAMLVANINGLAIYFQQAQDRTYFGVPVGSRDAHLIAFLERHGGTQFYTTYWVCDQVMFEAAEHVTCSVVDDFTAFAAGFNRMGDEAARVARASHPAYVFDTTTNEADPGMLRQIATALNDGDPHLRGYHAAMIDGYLIYYAGG